MRAHLVQLDIRWEDKDANHARVRQLLIGDGRSRAVEPGDLVVLPEMFDTGFSFRLEVTADADGRTLSFLSGLARELRATVHGSRTVIGPDGRGRNMATVLGPRGELLADYAKVHPFSYGKESEFFTGGDGVMVYEWSVGDAGARGMGAGPRSNAEEEAPAPRAPVSRAVGSGATSPGGVEGGAGGAQWSNVTHESGAPLRGETSAHVYAETRSAAAPAAQSFDEGRAVVCPAICYDLRFPELFRRGLALGAEVFALGANWPAARAMHRTTLARARAIENQAVVLCVNRAGKDPHLEYAGGSVAYSAKGEPLVEMDEREGVAAVEVDLAALREWRKTFPAWRDRRLA